MSVTARLRQLLLMLSSDQPGEVANAAAAITRVLKSEGKDWHALVDGLLADTPQARRSSHAGDDDAPEWRAMHAFCCRHSDRLRARELEFIESLSHWRGDLTEKQYGWLSAIHGRLRR